MKKSKRQTNDPVSVKPLSQDKINAKYADRKRVGKTQRDRSKTQ